MQRVNCRYSDRVLVTFSTDAALVVSSESQDKPDPAGDVALYRAKREGEIRAVVVD